MHYFDNAATTKLDLVAFEKMKTYLLEEYGNASQPYSFSRSTKKALLNARKLIAGCINAEPSEIVFTSGGSESDNWAIKGFCNNSLQSGTANIVTTQFEHHAILNACKSAETSGAKVRYINPSADGYIEEDDLLSQLTGNNGLASIMMVNNEIGTIQSIKGLCKIAHEKNYLFHTDAVQAIGHMKIDVKELDVDMLSASAHKFNGPKGIGFLFVKKGTSISPLIDGGSQEFGFRAGTENVASIVGMAVALKNNNDHIVENAKYITRLENTLLGYLSASPIPFRRNGGSSRIPGNISLSFKGLDGEMLLHRLDLFGCCVSTGSACDGKKDQISHVLKAIKVDEAYANGTIRISLSKDNTEDDINYLGESLIKILSSLAK